MRERIINTGILDIRGVKDNEEMIFENVGILIKENGREIPENIRIGSVSYIINADKSLIMINENITADDFFFDSLATGSDLLVTGNLNILSNVEFSLIDKKIRNIFVLGKVSAEKDLIEKIRGKVQFNSGSLEYNVRKEKIFNGRFCSADISRVDEENILINGICELLEDFDLKNSGNITVNGKLVISEKNLSLYGDKITVNGKKIVVKDGFEFIRDVFVIDSFNLQEISGRRLFFYNTVIFSENIDKIPETIFKNCIFSSNVIVNSEFTGNGIFAGIPFDRLFPVKGRLFMIDDIIEIEKSFFEEINEPVNIYVKGDLEFSGDISNDILEKKIGYIFNTGMITCSSSQLPVIRQKIRIDQGVLVKGSKEMNCSFVRL